MPQLTLALVLTNLAIAVAFRVIASYLTKKQAKRQRQFDGAAQARTLTIRTPLAPWQIVVGEARVGGVLTYAYEATSTHNMHIVVTLSGHPVSDFVDIYLDDEILGFDSTGAITTSRFVGLLAIQKAKGDEAGSPLQPFPDLVTLSGGDWAQSHIQQGRSKIWVNHGNSPEAFPAGLPNYSALIRGLKVYDPRTSPGFTAWSHNPALIVAAYLTSTQFGLGCDYTTEIDETALITAANICEERVPVSRTATTFTADAATDALTLAAGSRIPNTGDGIRVAGAGSPQSDGLPGGLAPDNTYYAVRYLGGTIRLAATYAAAIAGTTIDLTSAGSGTLNLTYVDEPRYTCNGAFTIDREPKEILESLLSSMSGTLVQAGGRWIIAAGAYVAPTITLDEDDLAGTISVRPMVNRTANCNAVKGVFTDPSNASQPVSFPAVESATYRAEDGGEKIWRDIDLTRFTTSPSMAQRLAKIELFETRQGLTAELLCKLGAWRVMTGGTVAITNTKFGWSSKAFRVIGSSFQPDRVGALNIGLQLRETASAIYDWSTSEEQAVDIAPNTNLPDPFTVSPPTGLTFSQLGSAQGRGRLAWTASSSVAREYQVEYQYNTGSPTGPWVIIPKSAEVSRVIDALAVGDYNFRVKAINAIGVASAYATTTGTITNILLSIEASNTPTSDVRTLTSANRLILGAAELASYPTVLPASLLLSYSGQATAAASPELITVNCSAIAYTSKPAANGLINIVQAAPGSDNYLVTGAASPTDTDFTQLAVDDWIYVGIGYPHFKVRSITDSGHMILRHVVAALSADPYTISGVTFTAYRGTVISPTPSNSRLLAAAATQDFSGFASASLTTAGFTGVFAVATGVLAASTGLTTTQTQLRSQWIIRG